MGGLTLSHCRKIFPSKTPLKSERRASSVPVRTHYVQVRLRRPNGFDFGIAVTVNVRGLPRLELQRPVVFGVESVVASNDGGGNDSDDDKADDAEDQHGHVHGADDVRPRTLLDGRHECGRGGLRK